MVSLLAALFCLLFFLWGLLAFFGHAFLKGGLARFGQLL
jgi:hypothetical protein